MKKDSPSFNEHDQLLEAKGPGPFVTKLIYSLANGQVHTWESRLHRKGIVKALELNVNSVNEAFWNGLRQIATLNWWISILFAIGALLFMLGSAISLMPQWVLYFNLSPTEVNTVFFLGSIPFTSAAFLQLLQAYRANRKLLKSFESFRALKELNLLPLGLLSALFQFAGTLLFNVNTFEGTKTLNTMQADIWVWAPDFIGSIFFLISGYMAFMEVVHGFWKWESKNISWWVVFINLLGCIAFMTSAFFAFVPHGGSSELSLTMALLFTFIGALCFFIGALLMLPEMGAKTKES